MFKISFKKESAVPENEIWIDLRASELGEEITSLAKKISHLDQNELSFMANGRLKRLAVDEIEYFEVFGDYLDIHSIGKDPLTIRKPLKELLDKLPRTFVQVSRNTVINLDYLRQVEPSMSGNKTALLADQTRISISRKYWKGVKERVFEL